MSKNPLTIRGLDVAIIDQFKERARRHGRSLEAELPLALQCGQPVHDCFYAACAEAAAAPLVSSDEAFLQALRCEGIALRGVPRTRLHELADA